MQYFVKTDSEYNTQAKKKFELKKLKALTTLLRINRKLLFFLNFSKLNTMIIKELKFNNESKYLKTKKMRSCIKIEF